MRIEAKTSFVNFIMELNLILKNYISII